MCEWLKDSFKGNLKVFRHLMTIHWSVKEHNPKSGKNRISFKSVTSVLSQLS